MVTVAFVLFFAFVLNEANNEMGFARFLIDSVGKDVPSQLFPALVFVLVAVTTFATSGFWVIQVITVPFFYRWLPDWELIQFWLSQP